ncbi:MAG: hypothetical protein HY738_11885, partial [Bacteroidia bacterium]|nr:hypothetical protein [Bacteroidia bacterium]
TFYSPHGHIVDVGKNILDNNNTLYQSWSGNNGTGTTYKLYLYKSIDSGAHFYEADIKTIYSGAEQLSQPSMVNLGGGCFLVLAKKNDVNAFRQFKNENNITESWNDYNGGITNFDDGLTSNPAPPWLSFINYQGVGIVACYYTKKNTTPHILKVIFGLAKDLLETNGHLNWNVNTKKAVYPDPPTGNNTLGYQSFFHPLNQFKGIGNTFEGVGNVYNPKIVFTPQSGMINLLTTLGL